MEFLETSLLLSAILVIFIIYSALILPAIDRRIEKAETVEEKVEYRRYRVTNDNNLNVQGHRRYWRVLSFLALLAVTFVVVHLVVILMHELSHSYLAVLLGVKQDPLDNRIRELDWIPLG